MPAKATANKAPTAVALLAVLDQHQLKLNGEWNYGHIKPFTLAEVQDFLDGKPGYVIPSKYRLGDKYTRSRQVVQALSAIGAYVVDRKQADEQTTTVYKGVWAINCTAACPYCGKNFKHALMMSNPGHCTKARCVLNAMHDRM